MILLFAAVVHATWNLTAKRVGAGGPAFVWLYYTGSAAVCIPIALITAIFSTPHPAWPWLAAILGTAILHVAYGVILQRGYTVGDLSVVYPLARGCGPLLTVAVAVGFLGERPGALALAGTVAVVVGVGVVSSGPSDPSKPRAASVGYGVLTGATIAGYTLWDAHSVSAIAVPPLFYLAAGSAAQSALLLPAALAGRAEVARVWRDCRREVLLVALLSPLGYLLVLDTLRTTPVSLVAPVREFSIVIGSFVAIRIFGEPHLGRRLTGAAIVLAGIAGIALG